MPTLKKPVRRFAAPQDLQGVDPILTNIALAYENPAFVAEALFPTVPVAKESGQYFTIDPNKDRFRVYDDIRAPRARASIVEWANTKSSYVAEEHAIAAAVDDREKENASDPMQPEVEAVESATDALLIGREVEAATLAITVGTYPGGSTTALAGGARWDTATGDPVSDVETGKEKIRSLTGSRPNTLILPSSIYAKARLNPTVTDRIKYTSLGVLTPDLLKQLWDIPNVVIADAVQNTAALGQTAVTADVWGKNVVMAFVNPRPALRSLSFGYTFMVGPEERARRWREEAEHSDYYETSQIRTTAVVANIAGYLIQTVIS